jgi:small subunit ribosomal protein S6
MSVPTPIYDLMLVLDPDADADVRARIVAEARGSIERGGELVRHDEWGERPLSYPIDRRSSGVYHLLQFRPASAELLNALDHALRIADGVLRFRIIKLRAGVPEPPKVTAQAPARAEQAAPPESPQPAAAPEGPEQAEQPAAA